jgi:hypothetical protein
MATEDVIAALLTSDLAQEVRSEFNGRLSDGLDVTSATQFIFSQFSQAMADPHNGPVVILSLAALQLKEYQLHPVIRDAAIDLIQSGEAAAAFPAGTLDLRKSRRELLDQFAAELAAASVVET